MPQTLHSGQFYYFFCEVFQMIYTVCKYIYPNPLILFGLCRERNSALEWVQSSKSFGVLISLANLESSQKVQIRKVRACGLGWQLFHFHFQSVFSFSIEETSFYLIQTVKCRFFLYQGRGGAGQGRAPKGKILGPIRFFSYWRHLPQHKTLQGIFLCRRHSNRLKKINQQDICDTQEDLNSVYSIIRR